MKKLVRESVEDILRPKGREKIVEDITNEIRMDLLNGPVSFFEHLDPRVEPKWVVSVPVYNIKAAFEKYEKEFGPGYYVMSRLISKDNIPLIDVFEDVRVVARGVAQYAIAPAQSDILIKELVAKVMTGELGRGFHINYVAPKDEKTKNIHN